MYENEIHSVLRCGQCNKPFDKQSTLRRHGYYCRSRKGGSTPRLRSCVSCVRGKARCDNSRPECSRCLTKGIECCYPTSPHKVTKSKTQARDDNSNEDQQLVPSPVQNTARTYDNQTTTNDVDSILDNGLATPNLDFANLGADDFDWNVSNIDFADILTPQTEKKIFQFSPPAAEMMSLGHRATDQSLQLQQSFPVPDIRLRKQPSYYPRSIIQRPRRQTGQERIAKLILHTLKSYLVMLQRDDTLPPFIHAQLISSNIANQDMETLTNCISLMRMIGNDAGKSRKLFWRNVKMECERLCVEYIKMNMWELLAAMQALSIYILQRVQEGETDDNDFDSLLIKAVILTARQGAHVIVHATQNVKPYDYSVEGSWKNWIYVESIRRLCIIYQIIDILVYFEPASMCEFPADVVLAPLPASKSLWEARDENTWKAESEKEPGVNTVFGLAASGELVMLDDGGVYYNAEGTVVGHDYLMVKGGASWEEWCAGMDEMGGLILLAAALVG